MALLSSVGEDILLPDELSCPEYEISSDLADKISSGPGGGNPLKGESNAAVFPQQQVKNTFCYFTLFVHLANTWIDIFPSVTI